MIGYRICKLIGTPLVISRRPVDILRAFVQCHCRQFFGPQTILDHNIYLGNNIRAEGEFIIPVIAQKGILPLLFYSSGCENTLRFYR